MPHFDTHTVVAITDERRGLHRVEAACLPENHASHRLLLKSGFYEEGMARAYLKINGAWRDHVLFGRVSPYRGPDGPDEGVSV